MRYTHALLREGAWETAYPMLLEEPIDGQSMAGEVDIQEGLPYPWEWDENLCARCGENMEPEHAHHKCPECGYIEPCCGW